MGRSALPDLLEEEFTSEAVNQRSFYLHVKIISSEVAALERHWLLQQNTSYELDVGGPCYLQDYLQSWILKRLSANARKVITRRGIRNDCKKTVDRKSVV